MRKMQGTITTKLVLAKETLRSLSQQQLGAARGGTGVGFGYGSAPANSEDNNCPVPSGSGGTTAGGNSLPAHCPSQPPSLSWIILSD